MKRGDENIDKLFKDAFSGGQFPMDEAMWTEANTMIKASKPKAGYWGIISATVALVAVIGSATYLFTGENSKAKNSTYTQRNSSKDVAYLTASNEVETNSFTKNLFAGNSNNTNTANEIAANNSSIPVQKTTFTKPKTNNTQMASSQNSASNLAVGNTTSKNTSYSNGVVSSTKQTTVLAASTASNNAGTKRNAFFDTDNNFSVHTHKEEFVHLAPLTHMELVNEPLSENPSKKNNNPSIKFIPLTLRLSAGYGFGSVLNSSELNRNANYSANQLNIDFSAEYIFNHSWGGQVGIMFTQTNETQRYKGLTVEDNSFMDYQDNSYWNYFDKEVTVTDQTWWLGGWWVYGTYTDTITDSNYVTQIDSNLITKFDSTHTEFTENQKISQIEIPVLLTYNFVVNRWTFQVATGASFGMFLNSRGRLIRFNNDAIGGIETNKGLFNSMQYNYLLSAEAGFGLNEHWRITARPQLKVNLNSMFNSSNSYSQKYLFYGLNVGLAFNF